MKKLSFKFNHWYPKLVGMGAVTIYPYILIADSAADADIELLRHEMIHVEQIRKMGTAAFYFNYLKQMVTGFVRTGDFNTAYLKNEFEAEAYSRQTEPFSEAEKVELIRAGVKFT